jgi:hypothetical protein
MSEISKETFQGYSTDSKLDTLFDMQHAQNEHLDRIEVSLQRKKKVDTAVSASTGLAGGFLAVFLRKIFTGG